MPTIIVNHSDGSEDIYPNSMAGISNQQGDGWKLSLIPTDPTLNSFVISLASGDTYQTVGALPSASDYATSSALVGLTAAVSLISGVQQQGVTNTVT